MIGHTFNVRKAAQVVAFFASAQGGRINVLKLVKLIYLADRAFMADFERPILYDRMVSMDHGPVNSATLDLINGLAADERGWTEFVGSRVGNDIPLSEYYHLDTDLDELSRKEVDVLGETWSRFGHMTKYQIRDHTHRHCPEWEDPKGSSNPIPYSRIFKFLQKDDAEELATAIDRDHAIDETFRRHRDETAAVEAD